MKNMEMQQDRYNNTDTSFGEFGEKKKTIQNKLQSFKTILFLQVLEMCLVNIGWVTNG